MIAIIDYGMGNLRSVQKAMEKLGARVQITQDSHEIQRAEKVVLPGVGAIAPAMNKLVSLGLVDVIKKVATGGKPFLGICLGLQLLFEKSSEGGASQGMGILKGEVKKFSLLKTPQIGWNRLIIRDTMSPILKNLGDSPSVYFCHSYYVIPRDPDIIAATTEYGIEFASSVRQGNIFGVQFHPEKSQTVGLEILKNFCNL